MRHISLALVLIALSLALGADGAVAQQDASEPAAAAGARPLALNRDAQASAAQSAAPPEKEKKKGKESGMGRNERKEIKVAKTKAKTQAAAAATLDEAEAGVGTTLHAAFVLLSLLGLVYVLRVENIAAPEQAFRRSGQALGLIGLGACGAHLVAPAPFLSVDLMVCVAVLFTINPVVHPTKPLALHMGTVPAASVLWLRAVGVLSSDDCVRALLGNETLRPYHLVVMFLGSVYLCTALERSGFLHTAALRVVGRFGRSPWGLFWALGCFSAMLTVLIPDDIVLRPPTPPPAADGHLVS